VKHPLIDTAGDNTHVLLLLCAEQVAIKKVLQDKRFKNRELQIMKMVNHPNIVKLKQCFYSTTEKDETFLHLVLEYVPDTVRLPLSPWHAVAKHQSSAVLLRRRASYDSFAVSRFG